MFMFAACKQSSVDRPRPNAESQIKKSGGVGGGSIGSPVKAILNGLCFLPVNNSRGETIWNASLYCMEKIHRHDMNCICDSRDLQICGALTQIKT